MTKNSIYSKYISCMILCIIYMILPFAIFSMLSDQKCGIVTWQMNLATCLYILAGVAFTMVFGGLLVSVVHIYVKKINFDKIAFIILNFANSLLAAIWTACGINAIISYGSTCSQYAATNIIYAILIICLFICQISIAEYSKNRNNSLCSHPTHENIDVSTILIPEIQIIPESETQSQSSNNITSHDIETLLNL
jgi:hypothetical protein